MIKNSNQYFELKGIVREAKAEMSVNELINAPRISHKNIDSMVSTANLVSKVNSESFGKQLSYATDKVMNSASYTDNDKYYASSNSEMNRQRRLEAKWNYEDEYFNYLYSIAPKKVVKTKKPKVTIKELKKLPASTYIPNERKVMTKDYKVCNSDIETVKVLSYTIYHKAIVLELVPSDIERNEYLNRQTHEVNLLTTKLVFRYEPFDRFGKPNKYDGITQLRNWLHSQKFITEKNPTTVKYALDLLVGNVVSLPTALPYNYSTRSDNLTVYTVFGDFDEFDRQLSEASETEYQKISDFVLRDKDSESSDSYKSEFYGSINNGFGTINYYDTIISYECHKEFRAQIPIMYNHINSIFD